MGLRCPKARPLHNNICHSSFPPSIEIKHTHKNRIVLLVFWKSQLKESIKVQIIKSHFERKTTSSILPHITKASQPPLFFSKTKYNGNYEKAISPLGRIGTQSVMLPLCFVMQSCKHWDTVPQSCWHIFSVHGDVGISITAVSHRVHSKEYRISSLLQHKTLSVTETWSSLWLWPPTLYLISISKVNKYITVTLLKAIKSYYIIGHFYLCLDS